MSANQDPQKPYLVLARKYRPEGLDELIGQEVLVKVLKNAFKLNRIPQAIMLTGVRGVGKTTTARILARALNYENTQLGINQPTIDMPEYGKHCKEILTSQHVDVLEMDAASNTSINDIREIIDAARYKPLTARMKVYIIDEVHMLSIQAFNGLLKTLEEPPAHVKFIFATTEIHKVPVTILSRCLRFDLRRVGNAELAVHLKGILEKEGIAAEENAILMLARAAEGSVRDALSLLDQAIALSDGMIMEDAVSRMIGMGDKSVFIALFENMVTGHPVEAIKQLHVMYEQGADPKTVLKDLLTLTHQITRVAMGADNPDSDALTQTEKEALDKWHQELPMSALQRIWQMLLKGVEELAQAPRALEALEMLILRLSYVSDVPPLKILLEELKRETKSLPVHNTQTTTPARTTPSQQNPLSTHAHQQHKHAKNDNTRDSRSAIAHSAPNLTSEETDVFTFEKLIALAEEHKDIMIKTALRKDVHLIALKPGELTIRIKAHADEDLSQKIQTRLKQWTGQNWRIQLQNEGGAPTIEEQEQSTKEQELSAFDNHPLVREFKVHFPDARLESMIYNAEETSEKIA